MNYKPTATDIAYAKDVNDRLIKTQTYNPFEIKEAYRRLFGEEATNQHHARSRVFTWFQYSYQPEAIVDSIGTMENKDKQSHSENSHLGDIQEDDIEIRELNADDDLVDYKPKARGRKKKE
jgi:hypothetical protein